MGISHRHLNCTVPHQFRDSAHVGSSHHQPGRERVSFAVQSVLFQFGLLDGNLKPVAGGSQRLMISVEEDVTVHGRSSSLNAARAVAFTGMWRVFRPGTCTTPPYQGTGQIVCHEGDGMAPNTTWTVRLTVKVTAPSGTVITENAATTSDTLDHNLANNTATVSTTVQ